MLRRIATNLAEGSLDHEAPLNRGVLVLVRARLNELLRLLLAGVDIKQKARRLKRTPSRWSPKRCFLSRTLRAAGIIVSTIIGPRILESSFLASLGFGATSTLF